MAWPPSTPTRTESAPTSALSQISLCTPSKPCEQRDGHGQADRIRDGGNVNTNKAEQRRDESNTDAEQERHDEKGTDPVANPAQEQVSTAVDARIRGRRDRSLQHGGITLDRLLGVGTCHD